MNIYIKTVTGEEKYNEPSKYLKSYLEGQGVDVGNLFGENKSNINAQTNSEIPQTLVVNSQPQIPNQQVQTFNQNASTNQNFQGNISNIGVENQQMMAQSIMQPQNTVQQNMPNQFPNVVPQIIQ